MTLVTCPYCKGLGADANCSECNGTGEVETPPWLPPPKPAFYYPRFHERVTPGPDTLWTHEKESGTK